MRIGVTGKADTAAKAAGAGFAFLEPSGNYLRELDDDGLILAKHQLDSAGIQAESINCFFPGSMSIYSGDFEAVRTNIELTLERAAFLGCKTAVIGSGKARSLKGEIDREKAFGIFCDVLRDSASCAKKYGITLAVEPLNFAETDFINTVSEAVEICRAVKLDNVGCLVDFYHFFRNGEELSELDGCGEYLVHAHLARPNEDRRWPMAEDLPVIRTWADKLREIGYDGRLTLECSWKGQYDEFVEEARRNMSAFEN